MKRIFSRLSSINTKLFLWFWLVTIITIASTRFVSSQLKHEGQIIPTHNGDIKLLKRITKIFAQREFRDIERFVEHQRLGKRKSLLVQNINTGEITIRENHRLLDIQEYLSQNTFTSSTTVKFSYARLTGPVLLSTQENKYRFFLVSGERPPSFGQMIKQIPTWLRILIPLTVSFLLCWLLAKNLSKPIMRMKSAAVKFGEGDLSARVEKSDRRQDELGALARAFNQMAENLQRNVKSQQRLLGDVSHELRSPLTRLQIAIALAEKSGDKPEVLQSHLNRCEQEVEKLDTMLANILSLSRLENAIHHVELQTEDITALITMLVEDSQFLADEKNITIACDLPEFCEISIDNNLIASAIGNVLNNAVKYGPESSIIEVSLVEKESLVEINISDSGDGVPDAALENLFKAFYRTSDARDRQTGGTGLGLAIAQQAVQAHNGNIVATNKAQGGLSVSITIPKVSIT